jgi:chorismate mutase
MHVDGSLERCIRILLQLNTPEPDIKNYHPYLRQAKNLRPDWSVPNVSWQLPPMVQSGGR